MPDNLQAEYLFNGPATLAGAAFDGFTQYAYDHKPFKRNGAGLVVLESPNYPAYATVAGGPGTWSIEITTAPYDRGGNDAFSYGVVASHSITDAGSGYQSAYAFYARYDGGTHLAKGQNNLAGETTNGVNVPYVTGHVYKLRLTRTINLDGSVTLLGSFWDTADPTTVRTNSGTDAASNSPLTSTTLGFYTRGSDYASVATWGVDSARLYQYVADTTAPTISGVVISPSGRTGTITIVDASLPILPAAGSDVTGFTLQARTGSGGAWATVATSFWRRSGADKITFQAGRAILPTEQVQVIYDATAGNVTDNADTPNPLAAVTVAATNNSAYDGTLTTTRGVQVVGTRGHAICKSDGYTVPAGLEFQSFWKSECPYGMAAGWTFSYAGFTDADTNTSYDTDNVIIPGVAVWISNPNEPKYLHICTFSGQVNKTLAPGQIVEVDAIPLPVLPGGFIQVGTWYKTSGTRLAYQTWQYIGQGADGDGLREGDVDDVSAQTLLQPFPAYDAGRTYISNAGQGPLMRNYRPLSLVGVPHPSFVGDTPAILFIGTSISVQHDDWGPAAHLTNDLFPARGWNGRFASINGIPYVVYGQAGSTVGGYIGAVGTDLLKYFQGNGSDSSSTIKRKVTHLIDEYGINTLRNQAAYTPNTAGGATIWTERTDVAAIALAHSLPFIHTTLTPMNTAAGSGNLQPDGQSGTYNQAEADFVTSRAAFNTQARAQSDNAHIPGCIGLIDLAKATETDWQTNGNTRNTAHGMGDIHPDSDGHQYMAEQTATDALPLLAAHPNAVPGTLDTTPPTIVSVVVAASGLTAAIALSETCTGTAGFTFTVAGQARAATVTGTGTSRTATFASVVYAGQAVTFSYAGDGLVDGGGNHPAAVTNASATNNSTVTAPVSALTDEQAETLAWIRSMIEQHAGIRRFTAGAVSVLGIVTGDIPDITIKAVKLNQDRFFAVGRQVLKITVTADGGDVPLQFNQMNFFVGFTDVTATEPPAIPDCIQLAPKGDGGTNILLMMYLGTAQGDETLPLVTLPIGAKKVWMWACGFEIEPIPVGTVTTV